MCTRSTISQHLQHCNIISAFSISHKLRHFIGIKPQRVSNPVHGGIYVTLPGALTIRPPDRVKCVHVFTTKAVTERNRRLKWKVLYAYPTRNYSQLSPTPVPTCIPQKMAIYARIHRYNNLYIWPHLQCNFCAAIGSTMRSYKSIGDLMHQSHQSTLPDATFITVFSNPMQWEFSAGIGCHWSPNSAHHI